MKVIVLGANGMIGHRLTYDMASFGHDVWAGSRKQNRNLEKLKSLSTFNIFYEEKMTDMSALSNHLREIKPDVIINALGIVKQNPLSLNADVVYQVNSIFPQQLGLLCQDFGIRLIQLSTDCIFDGKKGNYTEADIPDPEDHYGKSKYLGEVRDLDNVLTIRSSTVGHELNSKKGLLEWFLNSTGNVKGFQGALYSGFTTKEFSKILHRVVLPNKNLKGLYHIASPTISKFDLLQLFKKSFKKEIQIDTDHTTIIKRNLDDSKFRKMTGFVPQSWEQMVIELAQDDLKKRLYV